MSFRTIPADINEGGKFRATASGTLPNGDPVVVNADGTVTSAGLVSVSETIGSAVVVKDATTYNFSATYDSTSQRVVVFYADPDNSDFPTAVVGTVSGASISFGTPVVFNSNGGGEDFSAIYDNQNSRVVVFYYRNGSLANVGTISGTSISFGSPVTFFSNRAGSMASAYDSDTGSVVVAFRDVTSSGRGKSVVGTVSGTSISFGSAVEFDSSNCRNFSVAYDTTNQKVVVAYLDGGSNTSVAIVGTVSGTSISFGSQSQFNSDFGSYISATFDPNSEKVVIAYDNNSNSDYGTAVVGTVSGTSISFGTPTVFNSNRTFFISSAFHAASGKVSLFYDNNTNLAINSATVSGTSLSFSGASTISASRTPGNQTALVYDSANKKLAAVYSDSGNDDFLTSVIYNPAYTSTNLTAENFIGISTGGNVADTSNATVDIIGTLNEDQSGLTPGQAYYVQGDGTLSTTPDSPEVFAGTAISATSLLVKT